MPYGLERDTVARMNEIFERHPAIKTVVLYGSRAVGKQRTGSDIDLTFFGKKLDTRELLTIQTEMDDLNLPYMIDASLYRTIDNQKLQENIQRDGVAFYQKNDAMAKQWERSTIGATCKVIAGQSPKSQFYNNTGKGLAFYQGKKEFQEKYLGTPTKWTTRITQEAIAGDILMSVRAPVGPVNFATERICIGRGLAAIRAGEMLDPEFLFYVLLQMQDQITGSEGAVFSSINKNQIENLSIPLPPLPEQKKIVELLDETFASIATATANIEKNITNIQELFESRLENTVAGISAKKRWGNKPIGEVCHVVNGGTPNTSISEYWNGSHAWITPAEMGKLNSPFIRATQRTLTDDGLRKCNASLLPEYSVVLSSRAPIGHLIINEIPMATNQGCRGLIPGEQLNFKFLYYFLLGNVPLLNDLGTGATFKELSASRLKEVAIPLPPLPEQKRIVAILDKAAKSTADLVRNGEQKLTLLENLKQSTLHKAFTGKLTANPKAAEGALSGASA